MLSQVPGAWSDQRLAAFNALMNAIENYYLFDAAITRLGITNTVILQCRTDLGQLITGTLGPALAKT